MALGWRLTESPNLEEPPAWCWCDMSSASEVGACNGGVEALLRPTEGGGMVVCCADGAVWPCWSSGLA